MRGPADVVNESPSPGTHCPRAMAPPPPGPSNKTAGKETPYSFHLTSLPLIVVSLPKAHVNFWPRLCLFNHSSLHTDEIFP